MKSNKNTEKLKYWNKSSFIFICCYFIICPLFRKKNKTNKPETTGKY